MANLHDLPLEILALILSSTDSPRDLYSLIAASPTCLGVFITARKQILSSILKDAITPDSLRHALAVIAAPPPVLGAAESRKREPDVYHVNHITSLIDRYFSAEPIDFPRETGGIMSLWCLYCQVSCFVDEYSHRAFQLLNLEDSEASVEPTTASGPDAQKPMSLSPIERTRFQSAFFQYELYCRLFAPASGRFSETITAEEQLDLFLVRMEPWQVEGMSCVHNYLISLVRGFIEEFESEVIEAVLNWPGVLLPKPGEESRPPTFNDLQLRNLSPYENSPSGESSFMNKIAAYGLGFINKLRRAGRLERKNMIRQEDPFGRASLPRALAYTPNGDFSRLPHRVDFQLGDDVSWANLGYRIRRAFDPRPRVLFAITRLDESLYEPLREQGYVFWDNGRLESPAIRRSIVKAARMWMTDSESCRSEGRTSIETRLRGVQIRWSEMERLIREFGHNPEAEL